MDLLQEVKATFFFYNSFYGLFCCRHFPFFWTLVKKNKKKQTQAQKRWNRCQLKVQWMVLDSRISHSRRYDSTFAKLNAAGPSKKAESPSQMDLLERHHPQA